ncbi:MULTISPECIES: RodZ domain-containing protein [Methylococcus]|uniref:DUF4115 domain-containing protein n=1 Tax=Methylococcus capsulatus TaxID=414 RepID=A0ABZ2F269_METCP|nr:MULTISPECIES: RodZ domain-containing protein [Methylococcus]
MGDTLDNDPADRPGEDGAGYRLRAAREARKLGLDKVARELHLSVGTVGALERDDYSGLPPPTFVRGYLRSYARLLDLPEQEIVDAYNRVAGEGPAPEPEPVVHAQSEVRPVAWFGPLALVLVGIAGIWGYQYWHSSQTSGPAPSPAGLAKPVPAEPAGTGATVADREEAPSPSGMPPPASSPAAVEALVVPVVAPSPSAQPSPEPLPPEVDTLTLSFSGESWASVIDAEGKRLLFQTLAKGQVRTVQGKAPFRVTLGRPADTRLDYNGKAYDHGYTSNRVSVRFSVPRSTGQ